MTATAAIFRQFFGWRVNTDDAATVESRNKMRDVQRLRNLQLFFIEEAIAIPDDVFDNDVLAMIDRAQIHGLTPREEFIIDRLMSVLFLKLSPTQRRRFLSEKIPSWVSPTAIILAVLAISSLVAVLAIFDSAKQNMPILHLILYSTWLLSLGALGSISYVVVNALSIQDDITFDISVTKLMVMRIVVGSVFALMIALPVSLEVFEGFLRSVSDIIINPQEYPSGEPIKANDHLFNDAAYLMLPFILGFSTPAVIVILNRFVEAIKAMFGAGGVVSAPTLDRNALPQDGLQRMFQVDLTARRDSNSHNAAAPASGADAAKTPDELKGNRSEGS